MAGVPTLYSATACNWCHRCRVVFHAKAVRIEVVEVDLVRRPEWFRKKASGGSVPLLESEAALLEVFAGYRDVLTKVAAAGIEVAVSGGD